MFSLFWPKKDAQAPFSEWMDQTALSAWTWAALDINPEKWGQRRVVIHQNKENCALEWTSPQRLILQAQAQNLFKGRPVKNQGPDFVNAVQDTFFEWMCTTPRPRLDEKIENIENISEGLLEQEDRGLMWLKTSFQVIEQALNECLTPREGEAPLPLQAKIFAGRPSLKEENSDVFEWRIILFEIDFLIVFRKDARVEVKVFRAQNDPKKKAGGGPDLHAIFGLRRREVYDLFVQELNLVAKAALIKGSS